MQKTVNAYIDWLGSLGTVIPYFVIKLKPLTVVYSPSLTYGLGAPDIRVRLFIFGESKLSERTEKLWQLFVVAVLHSQVSH